MIKFFLLALSVSHINCFHFDDGVPEKTAIMGGRHASIEEAPYQAAIYKYDSLLCGAAIVSEQWLVSSAHCVVNKNPDILTIRTGASIVSGNHLDGDLFKVEKVFASSTFSYAKKDGDISLIKIDRPIKFSKTQQPIKLSQVLPKAGDKVIVSGFGRESANGRVSSSLKIVEVPVIRHRLCQNYYYGYDRITGNMFCAGTGDEDACHGDSGGPGVINGALEGVVSFGIGCGDPEFPGVYTRIDKFYDWIVKTMRDN